MLFDGDCPLCVKEVNFLRAQDGGKGKIDLVDIAADDYSPAWRMQNAIHNAASCAHVKKHKGLNFFFAFFLPFFSDV